MLNNIGLFALGIVCACAISHASGPNPDEEAWIEYCEMTALYKDTSGQDGWPDFNGDGDNCK